MPRNEPAKSCHTMARMGNSQSGGASLGFYLSSSGGGLFGRPAIRKGHGTLFIVFLAVVLVRIPSHKRKSNVCCMHPFAPSFPQNHGNGVLVPGKSNT